MIVNHRGHMNVLTRAIQDERRMASEKSKVNKAMKVGDDGLTWFKGKGGCNGTCNMALSHERVVTVNESAITYIKLIPISSYSTSGY
jgi:hypothetical protein